MSEGAAMDRAYDHVRWERLKPAEFLGRLEEMMGLCEPHGHIAPFGLDTIKAEWLCAEAAHRFGGIVAPTISWHIHETGYHAPWLSEGMAGVNPRLASLPPHLVLESLLYQLRAFCNAGFGAAVVISGHHGAQDDLRLVADAFSKAFEFDVFLRTDPELVKSTYVGDHAGRYEISQLLAIRPDLIDLQRVGRTRTDPLGRFAQNPDAAEASADLGRSILELSLSAIRDALRGMTMVKDREFISIEQVAAVWQPIVARSEAWATLNR
jgi:creatinine amidohydrolase